MTPLSGLSAVWERDTVMWGSLESVVCLLERGSRSARVGVEVSSAGLTGWGGLDVGLGFMPRFVRSRFAQVLPPPPRHSTPPRTGENAAHQPRGLLPDGAARPALSRWPGGPGTGAGPRWSTGPGDWGNARARRPGWSHGTRELGGTPARSSGGAPGSFLPRNVRPPGGEGLRMAVLPAGTSGQRRCTGLAATGLVGPAAPPPARR